MFYDAAPGLLASDEAFCSGPRLCSLSIESCGELLKQPVVTVESSRQLEGSKSVRWGTHVVAMALQSTPTQGMRLSYPLSGKDCPSLAFLRLNSTLCFGEKNKALLKIYRVC